MSEMKPRDEWNRLKFSDIAKQCKESVDRKNNPFSRYIEGGHMATEDLRIKQFGVFGSSYVGPAFHRVFRKGQILYGSRRTYLKKVAIAEFDGITANTTFVIEPREHPHFIGELLPYVMLSEDFTEHSILHSKGSTNPYINWSDIAKYQFSCPPIGKQREILKVVRQFRDCIRKNELLEQSSDSLENLIESVLLQYGFENENITLTRFGRIPKNWSLVSFEELLSGGTQNGIYKGQSFYGKGSPIIHMSEMFGFSSISESTPIEKLVELNAKEQENNTLKNGDLLFARRSLTPEGAGLCAIYKGKDREVTFESSIIRARPDKEKINPDFYRYYFRSKAGRWNMRKLIQTVAASGITSEELKKLKVPFPPLDTQNEIVSAIENCKKINRLVKSKGYNQFLINYINSVFKA
ncbi:restriction endonuclease subunit S [Vibrio vulnificus]|nr:restriction endonuclease subunit S [Vibrio vulnificus]